MKESALLSTLASANLDAMVAELNALRTKNLDEANFNEKQEVVARLGIKLYPSEDLESLRVKCQLNLEPTGTRPSGDSPEGPQRQQEREPGIRVWNS